MNLTNWKKRLGLAGAKHAGRFVAPTFALDVESGFIAAARLNLSKRQLPSTGVRELPAGVLVPSPHKANVTDTEVMARTIGEVIERVGNPGGRLGLLIPDVSARVALLQFESLPENHREAETLVRWRMREYLPYAPEEARLSYQVMVKQPGTMEILAMAVRNTVLAEYEAAVAGINGGPALVLPATVALLPLIPEEAGGQLLLHICPGALSAVVVASNRVRYWRTRALEGGATSNLEEVGREATRVLATCQDNLNVHVQNVWLCSRRPAEPEVELALAAALGRELSPLPANSSPTASTSSGQLGDIHDVVTPFRGLLANLS